MRRRSCKTLALRRQQLSRAHLRKVRREEFPVIQRRFRSNTDWTLLGLLHVSNLSELAKVHILTQPDALECMGMHLVRNLVKNKSAQGTCLDHSVPGGDVFSSSIRRSDCQRSGFRVVIAEAASLADVLSADFSLGCTSQCTSKSAGAGSSVTV